MDDMLLDTLEGAEYDDFEGSGESEAFDLDDFSEDELGDFGEDEFDDFGEDEFDDFGESRRSARARARARAKARKRRQLRRLAAIRRRKQLRNRRRRRQRRPPRRTSPRQRIASNRATIRRVGLESAVKSDALAKGLRLQNRRIRGTEYAMTAGKVIDELREQFPDLGNNRLLKTGLPLAPLLFLKPPKAGTGLQAAVRDPRIWGTALTAGVAMFNELRENNAKKADPRELSISPSSVVLTTGSRFGLSAIVRDPSGKILDDRNIEWTSLDRPIATVDSATGQVTTVAAGEVTILARDVATGLTNAVVITVK